MKTNLIIVASLAIALLSSGSSAQAPKAGGAAPAALPQIEIESRFFALNADAAERLGLTTAEEASGAALGSRLSKSDFEKLLGLLSAEKSTNLLSAPRVTTKSGQRAIIEVIREFRYPTEFEQTNGDQLAPTQFETRNLGVTLEIEPLVSEGGLIDIKATPNLTAFLRFVTYAGGKTQKPAPIPRDGFSQPIFDVMQYSVDATLRSEQTLILGGFEWHGADASIADLNQNPFGVKADADPKEEPKLLFITVTARLIEPRGRRIGDEIKAGGPVLISTNLTSVTRDRLPEWVVPKNFQFAAETWTSATAVDADPSEAQRKASEGASGSALSAERMGSRGMSLTAVLNPEQAETLRKALETVAGSPLSAGPAKAIAPNERYFAEATGLFRYPAKADGKAPTAPPGGGGGLDTERVDLQLVVEAQGQQDGAIDLNIASSLVTSSKPGEDAQPGGQPGAFSAEWKLLQEEPRWTKRDVTTSVSVWSGGTVVFIKASPERKDHLQILLISASGTKPGAGAVAAPESPKPPAAPTKANPQNWPTAIPVPGKPGFVTSPYAPKKGYVDVRGFPSGTEVKCPYSGKTFLVP